MPRQTIPLSPDDSALLSQVQGVCLDIDDTLTTHGKLTAPAFTALWNLKQAGYWVVPVTGRPAGWCDHFARFWPVDAVIGENGAFAFTMKNSRRERITTPGALDASEAEKKIAALARLVKQEFPYAQWASDQKYREYDLAIDFCEDVAPWKETEVKRLKEFCEAQGAIAKISSIHVNAWYGDYDKFSGFEHWTQIAGAPPVLNSNAWVYLGDSPNDEPLFEKFSLSVGVANVKRFLPQMKFPPRLITQAESGAGFCEFVDLLLRSRNRP